MVLWLCVWVPVIGFTLRRLFAESPEEKAQKEVRVQRPACARFLGRCLLRTLVVRAHTPQRPLRMWASASSFLARDASPLTACRRSAVRSRPRQTTRSPPLAGRAYHVAQGASHGREDVCRAEAHRGKPPEAAESSATHSTFGEAVAAAPASRRGTCTPALFVWVRRNRDGPARRPLARGVPISVQSRRCVTGDTAAAEAAEKAAADALAQLEEIAAKLRETAPGAPAGKETKKAK